MSKVYFPVRIDAELLKALEAQAKANGENRCSYVRRLILKSLSGQ